MHLLSTRVLDFAALKGNRAEGDQVNEVALVGHLLLVGELAKAF